MAAVTIYSDFGAQENKLFVKENSIVSSSICHELMGPDAMILVFLNVEFQASFFTLLFHCYIVSH